ncbi:signal peptide peptidase-like 2A isoform X2 [Emydura macquarii macquarii]|uniref:signal peptide peptidase-like 2A isoform X2 n=1 Tax=Emydura macquarii macquarii TaxID=1129001 RepID=UPI00352B08C6
MQEANRYWRAVGTTVWPLFPGSGKTPRLSPPSLPKGWCGGGGGQQGYDRAGPRSPAGQSRRRAARRYGDGRPGNAGGRRCPALAGERRWVSRARAGGASPTPAAQPAAEEEVQRARDQLSSAGSAADRGSGSESGCGLGGGCGAPRAAGGGRVGLGGGRRRRSSTMRPAWLLWAALWALLLLPASAQEGILHASGNGPILEKEYCIFYNPSWISLPKTLDNVASNRLEDLTSQVLCNNSEVPSPVIKDKAVVVMRGNCTFMEKARTAQSLGAKIVLIASKTRLSSPSGNKTDFKDVTIPVALVRYNDIMDMQQTLGTRINVTLYSPPLPEFDYSMVVIFLIALLTVMLGGYWSGVSELEDLKAVASPEDRETRRKKEENVTFTTLTVIIFVVICCVMLVLLYFFYKWLVYVIISVFCLASAMSLYNCLSALIRKISFGQCRISCCNKSTEVRLIFLAGFCIATAVVWAVFRNEDRWAWILQDILGVAFCLNFIKTLKMPNFKSCVILLGLLLLYDVFFVFITPFITKNGESIMVEVAAGPFGNSEKNDGNLVEVPAERSAPHEKLPVVIRVPRLEYSALTLCGMPFSLLGFGDIIVPGLLVAYCRRFDVQTSSSSVYYVSCTIAYAVGMVLTFVVLALMKMGQPALLYLVPCTLITSSLVAWRRKEMKKFWQGSSYQVLESSRKPLLQDDGASRLYSE